ncbi:unnamed protein product [Amoebophrya sp. A25]|nr:unnamed protein product [Amoebophrya sp. A25]|eukprot:GSA25T00026733001.1
MAMFGQFVLGPPGAGKTTYAHAMQQMCLAMKRPYLVINLDPGNESLPYDPDNVIDVKELITVTDVMEEFGLGPNGALIYAMEFVNEHLEEWLFDALAAFPHWRSRYLIFDLPGQVELYLHHEVMKLLTTKLCKRLDLRLSCVHLVDATWCRDAGAFLGGVLTALACTMHLELPPVNVLTKIDLMRDFAKDLPFRLDYYLGVDDLSHLLSTAGALRDAWMADLRECHDITSKSSTTGATTGVDNELDKSSDKRVQERYLGDIVENNVVEGEQSTTAATKVEVNTGRGEQKTEEKLATAIASIKSGVASAGKQAACDAKNDAKVSTATTGAVCTSTSDKQGGGATPSSSSSSSSSQKNSVAPLFRHPLFRRFRKFYEGLAEIIEEYNLVRFEPLDVNNKESVYRVLLRCDQCNGRIFAEKASGLVDKKRKEAGLGEEDGYADFGNATEHDYSSMMREAVMADSTHDYCEYLDRLQEKYLDPINDEQDDKKDGKSPPTYLN